MSFRFRKRLRIIPGLWISKKGASLSAGGRGATINVNPKGHVETVGLPGSGLSYRKPGGGKFGAPGGPANAPHGAVTVAHVLYLILIALVILWILAHAH